MADDIGCFLPNFQNERHFRHNFEQYGEFTDDQLRQRFRFGRHGLEFIKNLVGDDMNRATHRNHSISVSNQILIGLRFLACGSFLEVVGDGFGVHKSTVSRIVQRFVNSICEHADEFIKWPGVDDLNDLKRGFFDLAGFPNVVGAVDCTHIRIQAPTENEPAFVNRKSFHSINVQAICDHKARFTNIIAKWPGSTHDSHIFRSSPISRYLEAHPEYDGIILGDSGYACRRFLLTPFLHPHSRAERRYNGSHKSTRSIIERAFGIFKRRFHILHGEIRMIPGRVCKIVLCCAILHNIAIQLNEPEPADVVDEMEFDDVFAPPNVDGVAFRARFAARHFND